MRDNLIALILGAFIATLWLDCKAQAGSDDMARIVRALERIASQQCTLLLALITIEIADVIFAIDSVPAIFAVTRDPFIVYTSNIFAVLGLRSMYFMLASAARRFVYLKIGLAAVLILIGGKIIWNFLLSKELDLVPYLEAHWSLLATLLLVGGSIVASLWRTRNST